MPWSVSVASPIAQLEGLGGRVQLRRGKLTFCPTFAAGSAGSIAMNHSEQVASSPVSGSGATIV